MYFTEKTVHDNGEKEFALVGMMLLITFLSHVREPGITSYLTPDYNFLLVLVHILGGNNCSSFQGH